MKKAEGSALHRRKTFVRMWRIVLLLRAKPHTLEQLAQALGAAERTIRRDLVALQRIPLPIEARYPTRAGVRAADKSEWFIKEMPEWPSRSPVPVGGPPLPPF